MKKQFAFFLMGREYDTGRDRATFETPGMITHIYTVHSLPEACALAAGCAAQGVGAIELCGAFGEAGARRVMQATGGRIPVGYVTHAAEMDPVFEAAFGSGRKEHA